MRLRRLFIYREHSIEEGTQWAVFEPSTARADRGTTGWFECRLTVLDKSRRHISSRSARMTV